MRKGSVFAAVVSLTLAWAGSAAGNAFDEAGDRLTEGQASVRYDRVIEGQTVRGDPGGPFIVANPGNAVAIIVGCEEACSSMRLTVRAAGQAPLTATSRQDWPGLIVLRLPQTYARALSNYEVDFDVRCRRSNGCTMRWLLLANGGPRTLEQRGLQRRVTQGEWDAAQAPAASGAALQWRTLPTADDLRLFYPVGRAGAEGTARLQCLLAERGALRCRVEPGGDRVFGDAALRLSSVLRVADADAGGVPLSGRRIVVPIRFQPAES